MLKPAQFEPALDAISDVQVVTGRSTHDNGAAFGSDRVETLIALSPVPILLSSGEVNEWGNN
jgi:hypothetical protein